MPDHKYNYIKPTLEKSTLSILSVDCSHRLSLAIINSFSKHKQRESLCYRIKTRFDTPAIRLKSPKKKKNTGVEVGEENRKSRKREVLDFVPPPSAPTKDAYSRRFSHFGHVSAVSQEPRRRKLSFNFPRNSNKVARPGRVLGPGPCARPPPLPPPLLFVLANILNSHFTGLWDVTLSIRPGGESNRVSRVWSPAMGLQPSKRDSDAGQIWKRRKKFLGSGAGPLELPTD